LFISAPDTTDPITGIKNDIIYFSPNMRTEREPELQELANELYSSWINGILSVRRSKSIAVRAALKEAKQSQAQSALERAKRISLQEELEKIKRDRDEMKAKLDKKKAKKARKARKEQEERDLQNTVLGTIEEETEDQAEIDKRRRREKKEEKKRRKEIAKRAEQTVETNQQ
jgi:hypothetical protein